MNAGAGVAQRATPVEQAGTPAWPDSPGAVAQQQATPAPAQTSTQTAGQVVAQIPGQQPGARVVLPACPAAPPPGPQPPCIPEDPYARFLNSPAPIPLSPKQKGYLAVRDVIDPFNLLTITANSGFTIGIDAHTAYGPGLKGFGRNVGYSLSQDINGEFIGTFLVCSLFSEDPHYHRLPHATPVRRVFHALRRTVVAQSDNGRLIPNYENFITYPASSELSNLYVPGVHGNGPSTVARILTGLATDPVGNLITEFLPDFARHVHINVVFVQQIMNQIATGQQL